MASPRAPSSRIHIALRDAAIGLPVLVLGLMLLMRSPADALVLLAVSVVCTLGIGGLLWLALAVLIGWSLRLLWTALRGGRRPPGQAAGPGGGGAPAVVSRYVEGRLSQGVDPERLRRDLLHQGWSSSQVAAALPPLAEHGAGPVA
jgi:hypothetical protein